MGLSANPYPLLGQPCQIQKSLQRENPCGGCLCVGPKGPHLAYKLSNPCTRRRQNKTYKKSYKKRKKKKVKSNPIHWRKKQKAILFLFLFLSSPNRKKAVSNGTWFEIWNFETKESVYPKWVPSLQRQPALAVQLSTPKKKKKNYHPIPTALFIPQIPNSHF